MNQTRYDVTRKEPDKVRRDQERTRQAYSSAKSVLGHPRKKSIRTGSTKTTRRLRPPCKKKKRVAHVAWLNDRNCAANYERFKKLRSEAQSMIYDQADERCLVGS
ncbi:hypothetical protein ACOMHN_049509 [Nucella lapillus]